MKENSSDFSIKNFSLLYPEGKEAYFHILSETTCDDLSIDYLCSQLSHKENEKKNLRTILTSMPYDEEIIHYRHTIYNDFKNHPQFCSNIEEVLTEIEYLEEHAHAKRDWDSSSIWELVSRLKELEAYIECIKRFKNCIDLGTFESEALISLSNYINDIFNGSGFSEFQEDIRKIGYDMSVIQSITLGANLDHNLYPYEVGILSINCEPFKGQSFLQNFFNFHNKRNKKTSEVFEGMTFFKHPGVMATDPLMNNLTKVMENMLKTIVKDLKRVLRKYIDVSGLALINIGDEIRFYIRFIQLENKLKEIGMPVSIGAIGDNVDHVCELKDFYNIKLAISKIKNEFNQDIITNDLQFTKEQRIIILTGPNRGGKTVFTQGIGLAFLLFNSGVFMPCSWGSLSPCDNIFTHFPADENCTVEMGRLGEESSRLSDICKKATPRSLMLFNESFSSTSHTESLYISKDVVKYLCFLGARTCFNTHMHELAESIDKINEEIDAEYNAVSIVMGIEQGERSYKVQVSKPQGISFARDIAYKYGITFEQLKGKKIG